MKKNPLVRKFEKQKRWVNYTLIPREGRMTKVPFSPITKMKASPTDQKDWGTYKEACATELGKKGQIGITFNEEKLLLGIDIDKCLKINTNEIEHEDKQKIVELIIAADSYTEISPSGTGLHIYLELGRACDLSANRHANFEAYTSGRYFTVTGNSYKEEKDIRKVSPEEAIALLEIIGYPWGRHSDSEITKTDAFSTQQKFPDSREAKIISIDDENLLKKMFASKGGEKIKSLYLGDTSAYKKDGSAADMALLAHLAFWTRKNAPQMEAIWMSSPLGKREKTETRKDYRDRSIAAAIKNCTEIYESQAMRTEIQMTQDAPALDLLYVTFKGEKIFTQNTENICRILNNHPYFKGRFRYDFFKNSFEYKVLAKANGSDNEKNKIASDSVWRTREDNDVIVIQTEISVLFSCFAKVGKEMVSDAMTRVSFDNQIDSAIDWITSLVWDGEARLDQWLTKTYNTPDDIYHRAVASNWLKGLVKRIIEPGCKFDHVLVLEGEQGIRKSTSLAILGGDWHVETAMSTDNKDFFMQFQGKAIIEFSEGETLSRTEVKRMKAIITMQSDKFRPPYGRQSIDFPRRCVFAMTTNQSEYLKDETGNRRWLPVACEGMANIEWLKENREQLFAEAYHRLTVLHETVYEFPEEETRLAQSTRRIHDANEDNIAHWFVNKLKPADREEGITIYQVFRDVYCNGMTPQKGMDKNTEMQIADVLRTVIHLKKVRKSIDGVQCNRWIMTPKTIQVAAPVYETPSQKSFNEF